MTIIIIIISIFAIAGLFFKQQFYDFFISPDGLSIAASEICLKNNTGTELIVEIDTYVGAKVETFLFVDQKVCAPSPNNKVVGKILVGLADSMKFSCEQYLEEDGLIALVNIDLNGNCEWQR